MRLFFLTTLLLCCKFGLSQQSEKYIPREAVTVFTINNENLFVWREMMDDFKAKWPTIRS